MTELDELIENYGKDVVEAAIYLDIPVDEIEDRFVGEYSSRAEMAEEFCEGVSKIPGHIYGYIDFDSMGRDMEYDMLEYRGIYFNA